MDDNNNPHEGLHHHHLHDHHHHHHGGLGAEKKVWPFIVQAVVLGIFAVIEFTLGFFAHSVALVADSFHMLIDVAIAGASAWVITLLRRPSNDVFTYGFSRADVMMAEFQGIAFLITATLTAWEAAHRLLHPSDVDGPIMVIAAAIGAAASLGLLLVLRRTDRSMTGETGIMHEIQDLAGFGATIVAGVLVAVTGWSRWDALASFVVVGVMLTHGYETLKRSGRILLEGAPEGIDLVEIRDFIESDVTKPRVVNLHVWSINDEVSTLAAHVKVAEGVNCHTLQQSLDHFCRQHFGITHTTIQTTHVDLFQD